MAVLKNIPHPPLRLFVAALIAALAFAACDNGTNDNGSNIFAAHSHDWGHWTVAALATMSAEGRERRVCKFDSSHVEERTVTRLSNLIETVLVEGGAFMYRKHGAIAGSTDVLTTIDTFRIGKYPVTQAQWEAVMGNNPNRFDGTERYDSNSNQYFVADEAFNRDYLPVECVSWYDALVFANRLSIREGFSPAYRIGNSVNPDDWGVVPTSSSPEWDAVEIIDGSNGWRLPTERQWEFAAKGGIKSAGYAGSENDRYFLWSGGNVAGDVAWYSMNSGGRTREVGKKKANELGLYDMSGNIWEWCQDKWTTTSANNVLRGGSWLNSAEFIRSANAHFEGPFSRLTGIGFRLARP
ncbi:MAG: formylglycine-generating enzyme family protein [Treponema sp.]|nr:formylglycine-generating enzyme family protein [Treponema sp.]